MRSATATLLLILLCATMIGGCAVTGAPPGSSADGKCHGPDYNAANCVYLF